MSKPSFRSSEDLRPAHALLTPTWIGALALLIANDHWLKGADLIPGVLTGKISDFAGMIVAPVLLAALLGVRSRKALLACHLAVAAVFTGIQLSPAFADLWSALMGVLGYPWAITCDPTDLIALPMLALSWHLLVPAMDGKGALVGLRRSAVAAASVVGLWSTVATSYDDGGWDPSFDETGGFGETDGGEGGWLDVQGTVYIHNPNDFDLALHVRSLRPEIELDCDAIAENPGRLLPEQAFGPAQHWSLPPTTNVGVDVPNCSAVWVGGEGIEDQIIFLGSSDDATYQTFPGSHEDVVEVTDQGAVIYMDEEGSRWAGLGGRRFSPRTDAKPQPDGCEASEDELRLAWTPLGLADYRILSIESGVDGCFEIELIDLEVLANEGDVTQHWYLCVPPEVMPLEVGSDYHIRVNGDQRAGLVDVTLLDETLGMARDEAGTPLLVARFGRGRSELAGFADGVYIEDATPSPKSGAQSCPWIVDYEGCPLVERSAVVSTDAGVTLEPGVVSSFEETGRQHQLLLTRARSLALVDETCSTGSSWLPWDIDMAIVTTSTL